MPLGTSGWLYAPGEDGDPCQGSTGEYEYVDVVRGKTTNKKKAMVNGEWFGDL